jgi:hypothetical protein
MTKSLLPQDTYKEWPIDKLVSEGKSHNDVKQYPLPAEGLFMFNIPYLFNFDQALDDIHFIFNFRDPRDLVCNQFAWEFSHPIAHLSEEELATRRKAIQEEGIDNYALRRDNRIMFEPLLRLYNQVKETNPVLISSYAQLCLGVTELVPKMATFLGQGSADQIKKLAEEEHPSALVDSKSWIGQRWAGSDVMPGRARLELRPETFAELTKKNADLLEELSAIDRPDYHYFYGA